MCHICHGGGFGLAPGLAAIVLTDRRTLPKPVKVQKVVGLRCRLVSSPGLGTVVVLRAIAIDHCSGLIARAEQPMWIHRR